MTYSTGVGIDVSKATLDVFIISSSLKKHQKFTNSPSGIRKIQAFLDSCKVKPTDQIVFESTGDYHLLAAHTLSKRFNIKVVNPLLAKRHMKTTVRQVKNDKVDAKLLAEIAIKQDLDTFKITKESVTKRKIVSLIDTLEKHKSALKLAEKNARKTMTDFGIELEILDQLKYQVKQLDDLIKKLNHKLSKLITNKEIARGIGDLKGISIEMATKIIAILEDRYFNNKKSLVAFSGLDISVRESGKWKGRTRITKRGNPQLRKYLIQLSWGLLVHNETFQRYIEKFKQKGRKYKELLIIIARKFLRMLYGAMKNEASFNENFLTSV